MNKIKHILWLKFSMDKRQTEYMVGWGGTVSCSVSISIRILPAVLKYSDKVEYKYTHTHRHTHRSPQLTVIKNFPTA